MLSFLLGLIPGVFSTINGITSAIANERIALINATTEKEKIASQERINTLITQRDVLIADSTHSNIDIWLRAAFAIGPVAYTLKYYIWDKVLNHWTDGSTDPINPDMAHVLIASIGFYFLYSGSVGVAKILRA